MRALAHRYPRSSAAATRGNFLEIVVANLWINRLIGDSNLPEEQRFTWITGNPFIPATRSLESGLLGPVTLQASPASHG